MLRPVHITTSIYHYQYISLPVYITTSVCFNFKPEAEPHRAGNIMVAVWSIPEGMLSMDEFNFDFRKY